MKIVYSYINVYDENYIPLDTFLIGIYSAIKSTKLYGNSHLYTSKGVIEKIKPLDLPFTNIIEFSNHNNTKIDIIPKLITYTLQKEPYIHLDLDLIINQQLDVLNTLPVQFAHADVEKNWPLSLVSAYNKCYFDPANHFNTRYGLGFNHELKLNEIPNMGIVSVNDVELFSRCTNQALDLYYENKEVFDQNYTWNTYLEQALIHKKLKEQSSVYYNSVENGDYCFFKDSILKKIEKNGNHFLENNFQNSPASHFMGIMKKQTRVQLFIINLLIKELGDKNFCKIVDTIDDKSYRFFNIYKRYMNLLN